MKKTLTLLVLLLGSYVTEARNGDQQKLIVRATLLTRQMARKTPLNEGQFVKVRQLNLRLLTEIQDLQARHIDDPEALDQQMAEVQSRYEWDLATILWPRQMQAYHQAKAELMAFSDQE